MIKKVINIADIETTAKLAHKIWNEHYVAIIGQNQVDYMLHKFQSVSAITSQIKSGYSYYLISTDKKDVGYLCLISDESSKKLMISKIYTQKEVRGKGFGSQLIQFTKIYAKNNGMKTIWLTVNKYNSNSIKWYQHFGFKIIKEVQMDIGNNFIMDDYVLELNLN